MDGSWARQLGRRLFFLSVIARILTRRVPGACPDPPLRPRDLPELPTVNRLLGAEPLRPELSGLEIRPPGVPQRAMRVLVQVAYRWQPSEEFRRRQTDMRRTNAWVRGLRKLRVLPPILAYPEENDVAPLRVQPMLEKSAPLHPLEDLRDLEEAARDEARIIAPRPPQLDEEDMLLYRPLLPRRYRNFLRHSPYPRLAAALVSVAVAVLGVLWITQLQQQEAVAAGRLDVERHAARSALAGALAYGVDPRLLIPLRQRERALQTASPPDALVPSRARVAWYRRQAVSYARLFQAVRRLERRAFGYWTWKEGAAYADVVEAAQDAAGLGLPVSAGAIPACGTPACFHGLVGRQAAYASWLRETAQTLRVYGQEILSASDPSAAAAIEIQKVHALAADSRVPSGWGRLPISLIAVDRLLAGATTPQAEARAGALAHLDADALQSALIRSLPARAIVVSLEDDRISWYLHGKLVGSALVSAGPSAPTGVFHVQAMDASVPATWYPPGGRHAGASYRYLPGTLPDWMPFSAASALQAAPWRLAFGPGNDGAVAAFVPSTPGSIDLPPNVAATLFHWATVGTEVVVY